MKFTKIYAPQNLICVRYVYYDMMELINILFQYFPICKKPYVERRVNETCNNFQIRCIINSFVALVRYPRANGCWATGLPYVLNGY